MNLCKFIVLRWFYEEITIHVSGVIQQVFCTRQHHNRHLQHITHIMINLCSWQPAHITSAHLFARLGRALRLAASTFELATLLYYAGPIQKGKTKTCNITHKQWHHVPTRPLGCGFRFINSLHVPNSPFGVWVSIYEFPHRPLEAWCFGLCFSPTPTLGRLGWQFQQQSVAICSSFLWLKFCVGSRSSRSHWLGFCFGSRSSGNGHRQAGGVAASIHTWWKEG